MTEATLFPRTDPYYCSRASREIEETLNGTAPHITSWLLLEYSGRWSNAAFRESNIPETVKTHINTYLEAAANSKLLLIKRKHRSESNIRFYCGQTDENNQLKLFKYDLRNYEDLLSLELNNPSGNLVSKPFFLVCTNGKKDKCCAQFGFPLFQALNEITDLDMWESSHVGQHRFAPNVLVFPQATYYGRMGEEDIPTLLNHVTQNTLMLEKLRGESVQPKPTQAAAYFLRHSLGFIAYEGLPVLRADEQSENHWRIVFEVGKTQYVVIIQHRPGKKKIYASCVGETIIDDSGYVLISID